MAENKTQIIHARIYFASYLLRIGRKLQCK